MSDRFERLGWKNKAFESLNGLFLLALMLTMMIPFINVLALSFSSGIASMRPEIVLWPKQFSVEGYEIVWKSLDIWRPLLNSVIVTVSAQRCTCCCPAWPAMYSSIPACRARR